MSERYHTLLREKAAEYGLSQTQLNAICIVTVGTPLNRISPEQARQVLAAMLAKGDHLPAWAWEMEHSL